MRADYLIAIANTKLIIAETWCIYNINYKILIIAINIYAYIYNY